MGKLGCQTVQSAGLAVATFLGPISLPSQNDDDNDNADHLPQQAMRTPAGL